MIYCNAADTGTADVLLLILPMNGHLNCSSQGIRARYHGTEAKNAGHIQDGYCCYVDLANSGPGPGTNFDVNI